MNIHTNFGQRVVVRLQDLPWVQSPQAGVQRRILERDGGEVARATTVVRFAAQSTFPEHVHDGGEEFLVLEGVFADERASYPAGTYVRNPCGTRHAPRVDQGCTIFVKLRQFDPADQRSVVLNTLAAVLESSAIDGVKRIPLHRFGRESVDIETWAPGAAGERHVHPGGEEVLVLEGAWRDEFGVYEAGTWLRLPSASEHTPSSPSGCRLWVKRGHLSV
jgi:anti-sigma factor ChrR (cupin superfamily)